MSEHLRTLYPSAGWFVLLDALSLGNDKVECSRQCRAHMHTKHKGRSGEFLVALESVELQPLEMLGRPFPATPSSSSKQAAEHHDKTRSASWTEWMHTRRTGRRVTLVDRVSCGFVWLDSFSQQHVRQLVHLWHDKEPGFLPSENAGFIISSNRPLRIVYSNTPSQEIKRAICMQAPMHSSVGACLLLKRAGCSRTSLKSIFCWRLRSPYKRQYVNAVKTCRKLLDHQLRHQNSAKQRRHFFKPASKRSDDSQMGPTWHLSECRFVRAYDARKKVDLLIIARSLQNRRSNWNWRSQADKCGHQANSSSRRAGRLTTLVRVRPS